MPSQVTLRNRIPEIMATLPSRSQAITMAVAEQIAAGARDRAPVDTGTLRDSIDAHTYTKGVGRGIVQAAAVTAVFYWFFQEFGTTYQPANPFMIPATEEARVSVTRLGAEFLREL